MVHSPPLPGGGTGVEDGLDAVEQVLADERLVSARALYVVVGDVAKVVAVTQHPSQLADRYSLS
jgi:hypothetical protein